jgi:hypothetical protein
LTDAEIKLVFAQMSFDAFSSGDPAPPLSAPPPKAKMRKPQQTSSATKRWNTYDKGTKQTIIIGSVLLVVLVVAVVIGVVLGVVLPREEAAQASPSPPPDPVVPVIKTQDVSVRATVGDVVTCIAFDTNGVLIAGNCGESQIQGSWKLIDQDGVSFLENTVARTSQVNCMVRPANLVDSAIRSNTVVTTVTQCEGVVAKLGSHAISSTSVQGGSDVYITFTQPNEPVWTSEPADAQLFDIEVVS